MSAALDLAAAFTLIFSGLYAEAAQPRAPVCPGCNVLLISLDAVQARHVGALGSPRPTTPVFDALASRGILFTQAVSPAPWTLPATMSWFTGTYPSLHRVVNKFALYTPDEKTPARLKDLSPGTETLTEVLKKHGYATGGFTGDAGVSGAFGFCDGFDVYFDSTPPFSGLERSIPEALAWIEREKPEKFFIFLHGYNAHGQYGPPSGLTYRFRPEGYSGPYDGSPAQQRDLREKGLAGQALALTAQDWEFWRGIYDEKISLADAQLGDFMSALERAGRLKNTLVLIASDHGTEMGEHGRLDHGATLYEELIRVPLLLLLPDRKAGRRIEHQVSTLAIMPTVLELLGIEPTVSLRAQMKAPSLVPDLLGLRREGRDALLETDYRLYTHKRALRTKDGWKLIRTVETGRTELYDLRNDPGERNDLSELEPRRAYALEHQLFAAFRDLGAPILPQPLGCTPVYPDQCKPLR